MIRYCIWRIKSLIFPSLFFEIFCSEMLSLEEKARYKVQISLLCYASFTLLKHFGMNSVSVMNTTILGSI